MNLGLLEDHLLRALQARLGADVDCRAGPAFCGPASGLRAQVFVHAAGFADAGGVTPQGAHIGRQPTTLAGGAIGASGANGASGASGFIEQRPGHIDIEVACLCAQHTQAGVLAGIVAPVLLEALERLGPPLLTDPADRLRRLRFADHRAHVHAQRSQRLLHEGVAVAQVLTVVRLEGFLHVLLARPGGLVRESAYALPLRLEILADPAGRDVQAEQLLLHNDGDTPASLGGWMLHDAARRPNVFTFAATQRLAAGTTLRLWSGRGVDDEGNLHWGRRKSVWNNSGDVAILRDPDGAERARTSWSPPLPVPEAAAPRRKR